MARGKVQEQEARDKDEPKGTFSDESLADVGDRRSLGPYQQAIGMGRDDEKDRQAPKPMHVLKETLARGSLSNNPHSDFPDIAPGAGCYMIPGARPSAG